ncbi:MAG: hypothetical protein IT232_10920 [Flavobacteriales bacterium]|nr:hypothetical protein [Flavobacteriales bacterium]
MIIRLFKTNHIITNFFVVLLSVLLWIPGYYSESININLPYFSLSNNFGWLFQMHAVQIFISSLIIGVQAVLLNRIINSEKLLQGDSHLSALFFVVLNSASALIISFSPIIIANCFVIALLYTFFKLYNTDNAKSRLFNAGLIIGVGVIFFSPLLLFFPLLWIVLSYVRTSSFNDYLISLVGLCVPLSYLLAFVFLTDSIFVVSFNDWILIDTVFPQMEFPRSHFYFIVTLLILFGFAFLNLFQFLIREVVKTRKLSFVVVMLIFFLIGMFFMFDRDFVSLYILLTTPMSVIMSGFFYKMRREWLAELLFIMLCLGIFLNYFL